MMLSYIHTHTTVPISTRNDEEIADNHLVDTVYSSKTKITTTNQRFYQDYYHNRKINF